MALEGRSVLVVGGGITGLAVARALALRGARVRLWERAEALTEVGAGIQITPNGAAVLQALGLWEAAFGAGMAAQAARLNDGLSGRRILSMDVSGEDWLLMARPALISVLEVGAREAGVEIFLGREWDGEEADLIIGADGVHSRVAEGLNGPVTAAFSGQVAWRAVIPGEGEAAADIYLGPGRHLVSYPLAGGLRNIVAVEERRDWAADGWNHEDDPEALRAAFTGFGGPVPGWLAAVDRVWLWGLMAYRVAELWQDGTRVLLGDAAHPTLPFLAQGANLGLEDAWVLAEALDAVDQGAALAAYEAARRPRVTRVLEAAGRNARAYHLRAPLRGVAHGALRLGERLRPGTAFARYRWLWGHDVTKR